MKKQKKVDAPVNNEEPAPLPAPPPPTTTTTPSSRPQRFSALVAKFALQDCISSEEDEFEESDEEDESSDSETCDSESDSDEDVYN